VNRGRYLVCEKCYALYDFDRLPPMIQEMVLSGPPAICGKSRKGKICNGKLVCIYINGTEGR